MCVCHLGIMSSAGREAAKATIMKGRGEEEEREEEEAVAGFLCVVWPCNHHPGAERLRLGSVG